MFLEITVQARSAKPSTAKKTALGRAVRARKAHVRPGGLRGHGGLRTPCFGGGALTRPGERRTERAGPQGQTFHGYGERSAPAGRQAEWVCSEKPNFQASKLPNFQPVFTENCRRAIEKRLQNGNGVAKM